MSPKSNIVLNSTAKNDYYFQSQQAQQDQLQLQCSTLPTMSTPLHLNSIHSTSTLCSGPPRAYIDVGFFPGTSYATTVNLIEKDNPLIQRCSSSSHLLDPNNYPDNSNNFFANTNANNASHNRRTSRTFKPYVRPPVVGVKKVVSEADEALFGPIPTLALFKSQQATFDTTTTATINSFTQTPPIETSIFDFEEIDEKSNDDKANILDDDMVFEELDWITNTMNLSNDIAPSNLPLSPPLSPSDLFSNQDILEPLDDYVLFA